MRSMIAAPILLLAVTACASSPAETARADAHAQATQDSLERQLAGLTPGAPTSCLPITYRASDVQTKAYGSTILYIAGRDAVFRNDTTGGCENIARGDYLVTVQPEGRACSGDIARTVDPTSHTTTGSCALREFVPYRRAR